MDVSTWPKIWVRLLVNYPTGPPKKRTGSQDAVISPGTNLFFYSMETPAKRCTHIRETRFLTNYWKELLSVACVTFFISLQNACQTSKYIIYCIISNTYKYSEKPGCLGNAKIRQNCVRKSLHIFVTGSQPVQKMQILCKLVSYTRTNKYMSFNFKYLQGKIKKFGWETTQNNWSCVRKSEQFWVVCCPFWTESEYVSSLRYQRPYTREIYLNSKCLS
jgi:hypothetical protein